MDVPQAEHPECLQPAQRLGDARRGCTRLIAPTLSSSSSLRVLRRNKIRWIQGGTFSRLNRLVEL